MEIFDPSSVQQAISVERSAIFGSMEDVDSTARQTSPPLASSLSDQSRGFWMRFSSERLGGQVLLVLGARKRSEAFEVTKDMKESTV